MIILYPTETVYGLGVSALDPEALKDLYALKGRDTKKAVSWLVRDMDDVRRYAVVSEKAAKIAEQFLPGPLTLVLPARPEISKEIIGEGGMIGFRISSDPFASALIQEFMEVHDAPLTATSANVSGEPPQETPKEIIKQFGEKADMITRVLDGGSRKGVSSTVVQVVGDAVEVLREGAIATGHIRTI